MNDYLTRLVAQLRDCRKTADASAGYDRDAAELRAEGLRLALQLYDECHGPLPREAARELTDQILREIAVEPQ